LKVYISGSVINAAMNSKVAARFEKAGCEVFLPQTIVPGKQSHEQFSRRVYETCLREMERSDIGLLMLDCYGRDSSWEAGWYEAKGKPFLGWIESSFRFLQDFMIKGGLDGILTPNTYVQEVLQSDPILDAGSVFVVNSTKALRKVLRQIQLSTS